jgi:hypothetical protein
MPLFGKLIGLDVRGALKIEFVVAVVRPRKHPGQNRADKLTNDEATTYGHDISTGALHRAGLQKQFFKRSRHADDVDYWESTVRYGNMCMMTMGRKLSSYWIFD